MKLFHRHHSIPSSFLLVVLVACCVVGLARGKGLLSQLGDMINDGKGQNGNTKGKTVDYDAATGTVGPDVDTKQASTCDGQLASALVQANELVTVAQKERDEALANHKGALETITVLKQVLAETGSDLVEERDGLSALKDEMAKDLQAEKDRALKELESSKEESTALKDEMAKALQAEKDRADGIVASLKEESTRALDSVGEESHKEFQALKTEKDEIISSLEAKLKMSSDELEATMRSELEKAKYDKETKVAAVTAERDATVTELTLSMQQASKDAAEVLRRTKEEAKALMLAVEANRDTKLAELTQTMEQAAKDAAEVLQTTKEEAKAFMLKQVAAVKTQSDQAKIENDERLTEKNKKIKNLQEYTEKMLEKKASAERSREEATAEIAHWRSLHSDRSYCNMTHVATDMYDVSASAYNQGWEVSASAYNQAWEGAMVVYAESLTQAGAASEIASAHVSDGLKYSSRFINEQVDEHWPTIQPYYEEHIIGNYQTHIEPHMQQHVFPRLHQASVWFHGVAMPFVVQTIEDGKKVYDSRVSPVLKEQHQAAVRLYGEYCQSSLQEFRKASKESDILKDNPPPAYFMESWEKSCANPQDSLNALAQGALFLFAAIFFRRLLGLAWWIVVTFLVSPVLRFTPLGFVFSWRSGKSTSTSTESSPPPQKKQSSPPAMAKVGSNSPDKPKGAAKLY